MSPVSLMVAASAMSLVLVGNAGSSRADGSCVAPETVPTQAPAAQPAAPEDPAYVLGFKMKRIDGTEEDLSKYKGKIIVIVNVASKCGYTPQYKGLQKLYDENKDKGLVVLGFPANNFGGQEPGTNSEIAESCKKDYGVTFPMFEKISVKGDDQHPLYKKLSGQPAPIGGDGGPKWNFTKYLIDKNGKVVAKFDAKRTTGGDRADLELELLKKVNQLMGVESKEPKPDPKPAPPPPAPETKPAK